MTQTQECRRRAQLPHTAGHSVFNSKSAAIKPRAGTSPNTEDGSSFSPTLPQRQRPHGLHLRVLWSDPSSQGSNNRKSKETPRFQGQTGHRPGEAPPEMQEPWKPLPTRGQPQQLCPGRAWHGQREVPGTPGQPPGPA